MFQLSDLTDETDFGFFPMTIVYYMPSGGSITQTYYDVPKMRFVEFFAYAHGKLTPQLRDQCERIRIASRFYGIELKGGRMTDL